MLKIGLVAGVYVSENTVKYTHVLYTWDQIQQHNQLPNAVNIPWNLFIFVKLLERNTLLEQEINAFRCKFGQLNGEVAQIRLIYDWNKRARQMDAELIRKYPTWRAMYFYLQNLETKIKFHVRLKEAAGNLFPLFYAGIIDAGLVNKNEWTNSPINLVYQRGKHPSVNISIRYQNVKKNEVITYVKNHWKQIQSLSKQLPETAPYTVSKRDWWIVRLRDDKRRTYSQVIDVIDRIYKGKHNLDESVVKTAYKRAKKKIASFCVQR